MSSLIGSFVLTLQSNSASLVVVVSPSAVVAVVGAFVVDVGVLVVLGLGGDVVCVVDVGFEVVVFWSQSTLRGQSQ